MKLKGPFIIVSGPSGVGKTLFINKSLEKFPRFSNTVSWTTRAPRPGEKEGEFYYFATREKFEKLKQKGEFLESAQIHGEFYATSKKEVERLWDKGRAIIKDLDVQGFYSVKKIFPDSRGIFIYPPSIDELKRRILKRGSDRAEKLEKRLSIAAREMAEGRNYDFKIVNDSFKTAWEEFQNILTQALKTMRLKNKTAFFTGD